MNHQPPDNEDPRDDECMEDAFLKSAPERIYLDIGERFDCIFPPRFDLLEGVTWSEDNATSHGIEYVRADLASQAVTPARPDYGNVLEAIDAAKAVTPPAPQGWDADAWARHWAAVQKCAQAGKTP